LIDPQGVMSRKMPFYQPVQLADRENMVEIFDEDNSLEGTGTLSGMREKGPETTRRQQEKELEANITFFRRMKHNEDEARRKRELANRKKRGRYGRQTDKDEPVDEEGTGRGTNRHYQ